MQFKLAVSETVTCPNKLHSNAHTVTIQPTFRSNANERQPQKHEFKALLCTAFGSSTLKMLDRIGFKPS